MKRDFQAVVPCREAPARGFRIAPRPGLQCAPRQRSELAPARFHRIDMVTSGGTDFAVGGVRGPNRGGAVVTLQYPVAKVLIPKAEEDPPLAGTLLTTYPGR